MGAARIDATYRSDTATARACLARQAAVRQAWHTGRAPVCGYLSARVHRVRCGEVGAGRNRGTTESIKRLPPAAELLENEPNGGLRAILMANRGPGSSGGRPAARLAEWLSSRVCQWPGARVRGLSSASTTAAGRLPRKALSLRPTSSNRSHSSLFIAARVTGHACGRASRRHTCSWTSSD